MNHELHDDDDKTFLGQTGNFDGNDIINILMKQDATAQFIVAKFYRYFVSTDLPAHHIKGLATSFRNNNYEIQPLLREMFLARDFYAPHPLGTQIKSPVELVLTTYRKLGLKTFPGVPDFNETTDSLGQKLLYPPNVAGWEGGRSWITPATLVERGNFARELLFPSLSGFTPPDRVLTQIYKGCRKKIKRGKRYYERNRCRCSRRI
ncbi:MAG: hypothetical protein CM1200mP3_18670 [Chloroflexota bacterium]|nr:MAG: hypothetical protein CM1200mP3_18670 [Chloroflexota bacterium]